MARIVIATFGSYGDLFPYLALANGLRARGHAVTLATTAYYADKVAAAGVDFAPLRPDPIPRAETSLHTPSQSESAACDVEQIDACEARAAVWMNSSKSQQR